MRKNHTLIIFLVIFAIYAYLYNQFGGYYSTPQEAIKNYHYNSTYIFKQEIETILVNKNPITFYINEYDELSTADYKEQIVFGKPKWKVGMVGLHGGINNSAFGGIYNISNTFFKGENPNIERILFGIGQPLTGKYPQLKDVKFQTKVFEYKGSNFTFWYAIGHSEFDGIIRDLHLANI